MKIFEEAKNFFLRSDALPQIERQCVIPAKIPVSRKRNSLMHTRGSYKEVPGVNGALLSKTRPGYLNVDRTDKNPHHAYSAGIVVTKLRGPEPLATGIQNTSRSDTGC